MRRIAVVAVGFLLVVSAALLLVGWLRPSGHTTTTQAVYPVPQQEVWDANCIRPVGCGIRRSRLSHRCLRMPGIAES